jgi:hypothetical protein
MKKYRITTDNLDFLGFVKGAKFGIFEDSLSIVNISDDEKIYATMCSSFSGLDPSYIHSALSKHPSWFQKIEEKTYEILGLTGAGGKTNSFITKVKRLSDGEIFSVGDKVHDKYDKTMAVIKNFSFNKEGNLMVCSDYVLPLKGSWCRVLDERIIKEPVKTDEEKDWEIVIKNTVIVVRGITEKNVELLVNGNKEVYGYKPIQSSPLTALEIIKIMRDNLYTKKEPILTTEDGKEVYDNDMVFFVRKRNWSVFKKYDIGGIPATATKNTNSDLDWYFSTLSLAEKFVEENKPQFSKDDMIQFAWYYYRNRDLEINKGSQILLEEWLKNKQNDKN